MSLDLENNVMEINESNKVDDFQDKLIESIEEVLNFSDVVLNFLELNTPFKKYEIIKNPDIFESELEDLFGSSSNGIIELIVKKFYMKIKLKYRKDRTKKFSDYIREAFKYHQEV
jgi:hypothetical protein